jgi:hypothetical protein
MNQRRNRPSIGALEPPALLLESARKGPFLMPEQLAIQERYERGLDSYLGVLDAQRSLFAAQQALVFLRLAKLASAVRLYAVLGGGWDESMPADTTERPVTAAAGTSTSATSLTPVAP